MTTKTAKEYAKDYTRPELREKLKQEIKQADKGGKSGQWTARKAQLLTHQYEKAGGGYKHAGKQSTSQKSLAKWSAEH